MEPIQEIIARNLFQLRKSRGLSLDKVAELTGVSKGMLAQIEKGTSNPTVTTLWKIANGFQVSFSYFMKDEEGAQVTKIDLETLRPVIDDGGNYQVFSLFPFHPEKKFEVYIVTLQPGFRHEAEKHLGEEYIFLSEGSLIINLKGKQYTLKEGDALHFDASVEHMYINSSNELVRFFNLIYYPE